ncbi:MAG: ATP-dependent helicase, partial [Proteobacteria bacterium]|nr:ATP-dependent helicase [Pseudomonadota bacterium]
MARLALHQDVLSKLHDLPRKTQKKFDEFTRKFLMDSTQSSIHLEPYLKARDRKVRSARVGDDYRAIVIAPERGDNYIVVHIAHHDEAYRWCENKAFEANRESGIFQIFPVQEAPAITDAQPLKFHSTPSGYPPFDKLSDNDLVQQAGVPKILIPAVRSVKNQAD